MLYPNISINHVMTIAEAVAGRGTEQDRARVITPDGMLEKTINLFTCNGIRDELSQQYDELTETLAVAFHHTSRNYIPPNRLVIEHAGYQITFTRPEQRHNSDDLVTIDICKNGKTLNVCIENKNYRHICTALLMQLRCGLPFSTTPLADTGYINLQGAKLANTDLCGAYLREARLQNAILLEANLQSTVLSQANLQEANLQGANLYRAFLYRTNLNQANMQNTYLLETVLKYANLTSADLHGSILLSTDLTRADLRCANLTETMMCDVKLTGANLAGAKLDNISLADPLLSLPDVWTPAAINDQLDHFNNHSSSSLLTTMDSIDQQYSAIKIIMANELIASLQGVDVTSAIPALRNVLTRPPWSDEPGIADWLSRQIQQSSFSGN